MSHVVVVNRVHELLGQLLLHRVKVDLHELVLYLVQVDGTSRVFRPSRLGRCLRLVLLLGYGINLLLYLILLKLLLFIELSVFAERHLFLPFRLLIIVHQYQLIQSPIVILILDSALSIGLFITWGHHFGARHLPRPFNSFICAVATTHGPVFSLISTKIIRL